MLGHQGNCCFVFFDFFCQKILHGQRPTAEGGGYFPKTRTKIASERPPSAAVIL